MTSDTRVCNDIMAYISLFATPSKMAVCQVDLSIMLYVELSESILVRIKADGDRT